MADMPPETEFEYLYELYHENLPPLISESELASERPAGDQSSAPTPKQYRRAERVPLGDPAASPFFRRLRQRASYTEPTTRRPITEQELATLLAYAYGEVRETETHSPRRPVASGGAYYPLELYPIILDSAGVDAGIYHYNAPAGELDRLQRGEYTDWVRDNWTWVTDDDALTAAVVITARPGRSAEEYGEMAYLFAAIECGAVIQNLQLIASELDIGSRPHNGLNYRALRRQLRLRSDEYLLSTVVFAGTAPHSND